MPWRHQDTGEPELFICNRGDNENDIVIELRGAKMKECNHCWRECTFWKQGDRIEHNFNLKG